jgi:hypothetical protein
MIPTAVGVAGLGDNSDWTANLSYQGYLQISKYNIARFIVEQIESSQYHQHAVGIAN